MTVSSGRLVVTGLTGSGPGECVIRHVAGQVTHADHLARIGPSVARRLQSGPDGMRVLCVGGVPGGVYEAPEWTESGTLD